MFGLEKRCAKIGNNGARLWISRIIWLPLLLESVYTSMTNSKHGAKILNEWGPQNMMSESDDECNVMGESGTIYSAKWMNVIVDDMYLFTHPPVLPLKLPVTHANVGEICEEDEIDNGSFFQFSSAQPGVLIVIVSIWSCGCQFEGYSFTMDRIPQPPYDKLDRFLVTEGIISLYPSISALCLDRHLSDHRPILLREVLSDFGPTPFRFYQSWLRMEGFDSMVEHAWLSFSHF
ncbi:RNA-directed DNA polymerase, eukaryota [Tanacetum coccineum]|uniref:RNA-directed DNA polymerase, eukaryota n=1 Tax=Tanacetum coccineum TaxID=301880 RepID=A0ABQ4YSK5_9ASTR